MIIFVVICIILTTVFIYLLYRWLRPKFPIKVNCWFCNEDNVVPYGNKNCWDCPSCDQYNGFKEDGDYNKPIPAQYKDDLNHPIQCDNNSFNSNTGVLCDDCNLKQLLKTKMLANFIPINEANFDAEVDEYTEQLENSQAYGLCATCLARVQQELWQQDIKIHHKHNQAKINTSQTSDYEIDSSVIDCDQSESSAFPLDRVFGLMSLFCAAVLTMVAFHQLDFISAVFTPMVHLFLPQTNGIAISGLTFSVIAKLYLGKDRLAGIDGMNCPLWMMLVILESGYIGHFLRLDNQMYLQLNAVFNTINIIINIACVAFRRKSRSIPSYNIKRHQLEYSSSSSELSAVTNKNISLTSVGERSDRSYSKTIPTHTDSNKMSAFQKVNPFLDDTLSELGAFSLGSSRPRRSDSGVFSTFSSQSEITSSSSLSSIPHSLRKPRPLISPAKLKVPVLKSSTPLSFKTDPYVCARKSMNLESDGDKLQKLSSKMSLLKDRSEECGPAVNNMSFKPIKPTDSYNDFDDTDSDRSKSSKSSICPVDSTTRFDAIQKQGPFWKNPGFVGFILGSSLVFNMFMAYLYVQKT